MAVYSEHNTGLNGSFDRRPDNGAGPAETEVGTGGQVEAYGISCAVGENVEAAAVELEQTILDDLTARGLVQPVYLRKAREYVQYFRILQAFYLDIEERGVMVWDEKRGMTVDNPAVGKSVQVANIMQSIFRDLGFREQAIATAKKTETGGGVDDLLL